MAKRLPAFYAYPSYPESIGETIELAIREIAKEREINLRSWRSLSVTGLPIIGQVTDAIDRSVVFACDLTYTNFNVLFELGYAIGKSKRIWISLNTTIESATKNYARIKPTLVPIGYASYQNHIGLVQKLRSDRPWVDFTSHVLGGAFRPHQPITEDPSLLYLKAPLNTEASITLSLLLQESAFGNALMIDDPVENPAASVLWYADKILDSDAVIAHLLSTDHVDAYNHNTKCSFVCGLACGLGRHVFMLAHEPFNTPLDYRDLLVVHPSAETCRRLAAQWIDSTIPKISKRRRRRPSTVDRESVRGLDLRHISLGEPVAEHERESLDEYFVETSTFYQALDAETTILVGRRGTGKTAMFYALASQIGSDKRNHVCRIKPVGYEIDGLVRVLQENLHRSERGYLIESLWKFLIYSELACSVADSIAQRPIHYENSDGERRLVNFVEKHAELLRPAFSVRLDRAVAALVGVAELVRPEDQRARISERLHATLIRDLRQVLGLALSTHPKIAVLIDNLDDPWGPGELTQYLSELLLGLFRVAGDIRDDFGREDTWRRSVNLVTVIFIRSDIFFHIQKFVTEQDKLPIQRVTWNDSELLLRVIDERLANSVDRKYSIDEIWQLFTPTVAGVPLKQFILNTAVARPRDVIYLVKEAVADAINRGHDLVMESDFQRAREKYSDSVLASAVAEDDPERGKLEAVLFQFAGLARVLARSQVVGAITRAGVRGDDVEFYINLLCDINFLGVEAGDGFVFAHDEGERQRLRRAASTIAERRQEQEHYEISPAFYHALEVV